MKRICFIYFLLVMVSCSTDKTSEPAPIPLELNQIVSFSNGHFVDSEGAQMFPWGYNYTNIEDVGLIEDQWMDEAVWQNIASDFEDMKSYSANIVRIHLQYNKFMIDAVTPNSANLDRLSELVDLAEDKGLYLDITGLASYRKSDSPNWYDELSDQDRWETQKIFWKNIAKKVGHKNAVFAFNLMNEPVVSVGCDTLGDCDWLPGNGFGGFHFVQNISRDPEKMYTTAIKEWSAEMVGAIRSEDPITMITIGFLNINNTQQFENDIDYVSAHIYPESGMIDEAIALVKNNESTPLIIEETSNLHCNITELEEFLDGIEGSYHGLMGHYRGKNLQELSSGSIGDALNRNFIEMMIRRNPNQ